MRTYNIPVFVPHLGCPFDCVFCDQKKITGVEAEIDEKSVKKVIDEHIMMLPKKDAQIEIAFFGGSFTGIEIALQERLLSLAASYFEKSNISGIRVSTRPDYIDDAVLQRLLKFGVTTIELGVQSMDDEVLAASCRGHTKADVQNAVNAIRKYPFQLGLQMMTGLPKDTDEKSLATADAIISLSPDFVRIYPTLVIRGTALEKMHQMGVYQPKTLEESVHLCYNLQKKFKKANIPIIRIGLQNTVEIAPGKAVVAGPFHSAFGELVASQMYFELMSELVKNRPEIDITIEVNPHELSKAIGQNRSNIIKMKQQWNKKITIKSNKLVAKDEVKLILS